MRKVNDFFLKLPNPYYSTGYMNRRSFLRTLGLLPLVPLAAKLPVPAPAPKKELVLDVQAYEGGFDQVDPSNINAYFAAQRVQMQENIYARFWTTDPYANLLDGTFDPATYAGEVWWFNWNGKEYV